MQKHLQISQTLLNGKSICDERGYPWLMWGWWGERSGVLTGNRQEATFYSDRNVLHLGTISLNTRVYICKTI